MKKIFTLTSFVMLAVLCQTVLAQDATDYALPQYPPVFKAGPFPFGTESVRNDSPEDLNFTGGTKSIHEYTALKGTPIVDGDFNDNVWKGVPWTFMDYNIGDVNGFIFDAGYTSVTWTGWDDFSAWFKVIHDDNLIYVLLMRVDDSNQITDGSLTDDGLIWQNDAYQMVLDSRTPSVYDTPSPGAEIGLCDINGQVVYHFWSTTYQNPAVQLEANAMVAGSAKPSFGSVSVIEASFVKYAEINDDATSMFSIIGLDRDNDVTESVFQWGLGVFTKDNTLYGSIKWSSAQVKILSSVNNEINATSLLNNYPNPFKNSTKITYELKNNGPVSVTVYDITGKMIETLVNRAQSTGVYSVNFDTSNLPLGVYVCKFKAGNYIQTLQMVKI